MSTEPALTRVGVVMLGVTDLTAATRFYRDTLGLRPTGVHAGFAFFDGGGVSIALSQPLAQAVPGPPGPVEIVFSVESVRQTYDALRDQGVEFGIAPRAVAGTMWAANFLDPDGHHLSLFGPE